MKFFFLRDTTVAVMVDFLIFMAYDKRNLFGITIPSYGISRTFRKETYMIYSDNRKLLLSGWLKQNGYTEYCSPLKLQKFLLLYEAFTKVDGETADFSHLKGYKRGPVFSNVWGDYTHERSLFDSAVQDAYASQNTNINEERAKRSCFIVSILSENELSSLTHALNIWKSKETRIMQGEYQVALDENDFNDDDRKTVSLLEKMYPISLIDNSHIININNHNFIFSKDDAKKLTEQHFDTLGILSCNDSLTNPVYVELDEKGRLIVD